MAEVRNEARNEVRKEYIEREAVLEEFEEIDPYDYNDEFDVWLDCQLTIKNAPKADVVKVRRGEWRTAIEYNESRVTECSACHKEFYFMKKGQLNIDKMNYCPNCGADMRGEKNDKDRES